MRPDPQGRLLRLEQRLSTFNQVAPSTSRSTALDILTGRVADQHLGSLSAHRQHAAGPLLADPNAAVAAAATRLHPRVTYLTARAFLDSGDAVHAHESTTVRPLPAWAGPRDEAAPRLHLARPTRKTPRLSLFVRVLVLALGAMCVVAAAGFEVLAFTGGPDLSGSSVVLATASPDAATSPPMVAPIDSVYAVDSIVPTIEPSPSVPVPASSMGLLVDERFTSNAANWPNDAHGTAWLADGAYRLSARQAAHFVAVSIPNTRDLGDAVVTAWFRKLAGPAGGGYGLILRDGQPEARDGYNQSGRYYVFEAGDRGEVGVWLRNEDHWIDLLSWTPSEAVRTGTAGNELTVTAIGDRLSFLVNGSPVASQTDTLLHTGAAGVFVGGDGNEVVLDRVAVSVPR